MTRQAAKSDIQNNRKNNSINAFLVIWFPLILLIVTGLIGYDEPIKAQSDNTNPIIMHIHPRLDVLENGSPIIVPAQVGIDPSMWHDHSLDEFGMQAMPEMNMIAMAPLHTHDNSGIVHVESTINRNYTLGEFLNIWGLNLKDKTVKATTNDKPLENFREHIFSDDEQIRLEIQ
jgi:hypothetical protein